VDGGAAFEVEVLCRLLVCPALRIRSARWSEGTTRICLPAKMSRCWTGGMPSFSSIRSLMVSTFAS
jgi:hypothetical protein